MCILLPSTIKISFDPDYNHSIKIMALELQNSYRRMKEVTAITLKGRHKKNRLFLGNSTKQRIPPTHRYGLGLT